MPYKNIKNIYIISNNKRHFPKRDFMWYDHATFFSLRNYLVTTLATGVSFQKLCIQGVLVNFIPGKLNYEQTYVRK